MSPPFRSYALISREQIARNFRNIRSVTGPGFEVAGVVKADAYGHGALEVSRVLVAERAKWLAVASVDEGVNLRAGGIHGVRILVMGGWLQHESDTLVEYDLTPAVHSLEQIVQLERLACSLGKPIRYHLKIDSGMGRLGTRGDTAEILSAIEQAPHAHLEGLMSHFASADDYTSTQTGDQLARFRSIYEGLRQAGVTLAIVHASNTNAIGFGRTPGWSNMVRVGLSLYGYVSPARGEAPPQLLNVQPALTWKARLLAVKDLPEGALVGYGGTYRTPRPMRIGIVGAGYADGVFRQLSNCGQMIAGGRLTPILGMVSMDVTTIDLSHACELKAGDEVTLIGREGSACLDAHQVANAAGTISYHVLCSIGPRVRRIYF